jgi:mono/diheme cytochrome c family protein
MSEPNPAMRPLVWVLLVGAILVVPSLQAQGPTPAQLTQGDSLFNGHRMGACWSCHGENGKGTNIAPKLAGNPKWINIDGSLDAIRGVITHGIPKPKKHPGAMPPMGGAQLTPDQIDALAAYVYSLSSHK